MAITVVLSAVYPSASCSASGRHSCFPSLLLQSPATDGPSHRIPLLSTTKRRFLLALRETPHSFSVESPQALWDWMFPGFWRPHLPLLCSHVPPPPLRREREKKKAGGEGLKARGY